MIKNYSRPQRQSWPAIAPRVMSIVVLITSCFWVTLFASAQANSPAGLNQVEQLRLWHSPDRTRIVFDVSEGVKHRMFTLDNPLRLVVDIENANLSQKLPSLDFANPHIADIRSGRPTRDQLRFVFELKKSLKPNDFILSPNELYGHRLVVDLEDFQSTSTNAMSTAAEKVAIKAPDVGNLPFLIAVDAGHGGEDPGALGYRGSREKKITLQIAKKLVDRINSDPTMRAFLVREGDYYIKLHRRRELARERNADMFISIHADAFTKASASGFSVFALSQRGATSAMASALAEKENASDLIGGVSLADKDEVLAKVLVDLSMTNTISESVNFGGRVLKELGKLGKLHSKRVEQAGFAVLKSPDIPSVLIETGFITNPQEEQRLRSSSFQSKLASALYTAIKDYRGQVPFRTSARYASATNSAVSTGSSDVYQSLVKPPKPAFHKVVRGDSLSKIAERYRTSVARLKSLNGLKSNTVMLGQRLKIPGGSTGNASSSKVSSSKPVTKPSYHTVRRGDSLSKISSRYNVTISSLKRLNNLSKNTVYVGQKLKLPGGSSAVVSKPRVHVVKRGDTLSEIAERYGASMRQIMRANSMRSRTVQLGQKLKIP